MGKLECYNKKITRGMKAYAKWILNSLIWERRSLFVEVNQAKTGEKVGLQVEERGIQETK